MHDEGTTEGVALEVATSTSEVREVEREKIAWGSIAPQEHEEDCEGVSHKWVDGGDIEQA